MEGAYLVWGREMGCNVEPVLSKLPCLALLIKRNNDISNGFICIKKVDKIIGQYPNIITIL